MNMATYSLDIPNIGITSGDYKVHLAEDTESLNNVYRLRFEVFNLEMDEGLDISFSTGLDKDEFDLQCHHLVVTQISSNRVVGTYRIQTKDMAEKGLGWYTKKEYNLKKFPAKILSNSVEVGRACVAKDHRHGRVLFLLWRGLAAYLKTSQKTILFGCCSLPTTNPQAALWMSTHCKENNYMHPQLFALPNEQYQLEMPKKIKNGFSVDIPPLFAMYLRYGAHICSSPAKDDEFKTIDFLVLLDTAKFDQKTYRKFFAD